MHPALRVAMKSTIFVRSIEGKSDSGVERLGPARRIICYVEKKTRTIKGMSGEDISTTHLIITADTDPIAKTDRIWLGPNADTEDTSRSKQPVRVDELPDFRRLDTTDHFEVYL